MSRPSLWDEYEQQLRENRALRQNFAQYMGWVRELLEGLLGDRRQAYAYPALCKHCKTESTRLRRGLCPRCYQRFRRNLRALSQDGFTRLQVLLEKVSDEGKILT